MMRFDTKYGDGIPIQCHLGDLRTGGQKESHFELVRYGMGIIYPSTLLMCRMIRIVL